MSLKLNKLTKPQTALFLWPLTTRYLCLYSTSKGGGASYFPVSALTDRLYARNRLTARNCAAFFVTHDLGQYVRQVTGTERFATKPCQPQHTRFVRVHHMAEPGAQDNRYVWANPPQCSCQLFTGQMGHGLIRDHHAE